MKPLLIFLLMSIIILPHCESNLPIIGKKGKTKAEKTQYAIFENCWFGSLLTPPQTEYRVVDNNDGTVSLNKVDITGTNLCIIPGLGKKEKNTSVYYSKKCIQGQVYRSAQNDCKGTGTAANYYGAQKFQFCPTNVSTCGDLSPAKISCMNDTTGGVTRDGSFSKFVSYYSEIKSYFKGRTDEIPSAKTDYYWDSTSKIAFNVDGQLADPTPNYDSFQYILCY